MITNSMAGAPICRRPMNEEDERACGDTVAYRQAVLPYGGTDPDRERQYRETVLDRRAFRSAAYQRQSEHRSGVVRMAHGRPFLARHEAGVRP